MNGTQGNGFTLYYFSWIPSFDCLTQEIKFPGKISETELKKQSRKLARLNKKVTATLKC